MMARGMGRPEAEYRSYGYRDGLQGLDNRRSLYPPQWRFTYDAGHADGECVLASLVRQPKGGAL